MGVDLLTLAFPVLPTGQGEEELPLCCLAQVVDGLAGLGTSTG